MVNYHASNQRQLLPSTPPRCNPRCIGPVGPQGPPGEQGPQGSQGVQGNQGMAGSSGGTGASGPSGPSGGFLAPFYGSNDMMGHIYTFTSGSFEALYYGDNAMYDSTNTITAANLTNPSDINGTKYTVFSLHSYGTYLVSARILVNASATTISSPSLAFSVYGTINNVFVGFPQFTVTANSTTGVPPMDAEYETEAFLIVPTATILPATFSIYLVNHVTLVTNPGSQITILKVQ